MNIIEKIENLPDFIFETAPEEFSRMVRLEDVRAIIEEYKNAQEPFGYFKAEPFGWTDCAETDEGAIVLYENPPLSDETVKVPEGYALVPIEPSESMLNAALNGTPYKEDNKELMLAAYKAMIDEAMKADK